LSQSGCAALVAIAAATAACAGRARVTGPPPVFPVATLWVTPLPEGIEAPLATDGARLFVATRDGVVAALDARTGAVAWRVEQRPGALAYGAGALVVRGATGAVWSLDPSSGRERWKAESGVAGALPAVLDDQRVVVGGEGLAALDARNGHALWTAQDQPKVTARPALSPLWVISGEENALRRRDAATGRTLWTLAARGPILAPALVDDRRRVFVGTTDRRFAAVDLDDGDVGWRWKVGADVQAPAVVFEDRVLVATHEDVLYAFKRGNGHVAWRSPLPSRPFGAPLLVGGAVLVACHESDLVGFDARTGRRLGAIRTPGEMRAPPVLAQDRLFVGMRDRSVVALKLTLADAPAGPRGDPANTRGAAGTASKTSWASSEPGKEEAATPPGR
jgi:outer membrane protein assembly factor BamB